MKKFVSFLLVCCIVLSLSAAFAADLSITAQPTSSGSVVLKAKAAGAASVAWYFINPETGEEIAAVNIAKQFKGLKVDGAKKVTMTLKNIPAEMKGWEVCFRITNKKKTETIESEHFRLFVGGLYPMDYQLGVPAPAVETVEIVPEPQAQEPAPAAEETAPAEAVSPGTPKEILYDENGDMIPQTITVSGTNVSLVPLNAYGEVLEDQAASVITFEGTGSFIVRADGDVKYWTVNGIRIDPLDPVSSFRMKDVNRDMVISATLAGSASDTAYSGQMVQVTCDGCVFSCKKAGLSAVTSGSVPAGAKITVVTDNVKAAENGYSINGGPAENKGMPSFQMVVSSDTSIQAIQ